MSSRPKDLFVERICLQCCWLLAIGEHETNAPHEKWCRKREKRREERAAADVIREEKGKCAVSHQTHVHTLKNEPSGFSSVCVCLFVCFVCCQRKKCFACKLLRDGHPLPITTQHNTTQDNVFVSLSSSWFKREFWKRRILFIEMLNTLEASWD